MHLGSAEGRVPSNAFLVQVVHILRHWLYCCTVSERNSVLSIKLWLRSTGLHAVQLLVHIHVQVWICAFGLLLLRDQILLHGQTTHWLIQKADKVITCPSDTLPESYWKFIQSNIIFRKFMVGVRVCVLLASLEQSYSLHSSSARAYLASSN